MKEKLPLILTVSEQRSFRVQTLLEKTILKIDKSNCERPRTGPPYSRVHGEGWNIVFTEGTKPRIDASLPLGHLNDLVVAVNQACLEFPDPTADFEDEVVSTNE